MMLSCVLLACSLTTAPPPPEAAPQQAPKIVLVDDDAELDAALAARVPRRDVAVHLVAVSVPGETPATVRVFLVADIDAHMGSAPLASVAYVFHDEKGRPSAHTLRRGELRRRPSGALVFLDVVTVAPGTYDLKIAALTDNQVGTAEAMVTARVQTAGAFRLGDLVVGDTPGDDLAWSLAAGNLVRGDQLVASLSLGVDAALPPDLAIAVEVAKDPSGASMLSAPAQVLAGEGRTRLAQAVIDAHVLPPGDYSARAVVSAGGKEAARLVTRFSINRTLGSTVPLPRSGSAAGTFNGAPVFRPEDVLDPAVLAPFLDDLVPRASDQTRPAIRPARDGRFSEAASVASSGAPDDPVRPFLLGLSLYSQRQWQAASEAFRETLRAAPDYFVGAFYIGACYAAGGRDPQAINAWQTSLVGLDQYPVVYRLLGEAMSRAGQPDRAVEMLSEATGKWPGDRDLRLRLARAALAARRDDMVNELTDATLARPEPDFELVLVGLQAIFERVMQSAGPVSDDLLARMRRYRDAYATAGGPQQALVAEWLAAVEKKSGR
jgi:tetratricopeptide (TPR) repeat protein